MALPTKEGTQAPAQMAPTHMPEHASQTKPVLFDDIDPVLLIRLYPHAKSLAGMRHEAVEAGEKAMKDGEHLQASQQEPVAGAPTPPVPAHA